jgi:flagellar biosynthesis/type III secretory pathway protein FliH
MASGNYEYQSDFARRYFGQGKAEGKAEGIAEGKAEGKAEAVLAVLAARRIAVPDEIRARITTCADVALLDRWLARAVTALAAADVVCE